MEPLQTTPQKQCKEPASFLIREYQSILNDEAKLSAATIMSYIGVLKTFILFCISESDPYCERPIDEILLSVDKPFTERYTNYLIYERGAKKTSVVTILTGIRQFYDFLVETNRIEQNPFPFRSLRKLSKTTYWLRLRPKIKKVRQPKRIKLPKKVYWLRLRPKIKKVKRPKKNKRLKKVYWLRLRPKRIKRPKKQIVTIEQVIAGHPMGEQLREAIEKWLVHITRFADRTQLGYRSVFRHFYKSLPIHAEQITREHIEQYIQTVKGINTTKNKHLMTIKSFCRWMSEYYDLPNPTSKIRKLREDPHKQKIITDAEYKRILAACKNQEQRDIVEWLGNTGVREAEFRSLAWENVSYDRRYITLIGKGRKKRIVPLNDACRQILVRKTNPDTYLFKISKNKLYRLFKTLSRKAGLSFTASAHAYRHYFCTCLVRAGVPIVKVSKVLGHSDLTTTLRIYTHLLPDDILGITDVLIDTPTAREGDRLCNQN